MKKDKKHMTESQRCRINAKLNEGCRSFTEIAKDIGVDSTTVSREIKSHMITEESGCYGRPFNDCSKRKSCPVSFSCDQMSSCKRNKCVNCNKRCSPQLCKEYEKEVCEKLKKPPYVCNGCRESTKCTLEKHYYKPVIAQCEYEATLSESRQVIHVTQEQIEEMNHTLSNGCSKNQSINHMCSYAGDAIPVCERTVYNYVNQGLLPGVKRIDLPKAVKYRKRRKKSDQRVIENREIFKGRTYADYRLRMKDDPSATVVQMDTVEGPKNGSGVVLLTLEFSLSKLQLAFRLEAKTSENVIACFREIENKLGTELYKQIFQLVLTDRGD